MTLDDGTPANEELLSLHASAQQLVETALADLDANDLTAPTPCADWDLRALLEHMLGQNLGLAASARGGGADLATWRPLPLGPDPAASIASSARELTTALAARGLEGTLWMPEIMPTAELPAWTAVLAHLVDTVVHGWDVAASLGKDYVVPPDILRVAAAAAHRVPGGESRLRPRAAFGPALTAEQGDTLARMLAHLGRSQDFRSAVSATGASSRSNNAASTDGSTGGSPVKAAK